MQARALIQLGMFSEALEFLNIMELQEKMLNC